MRPPYVDPIPALKRQLAATIVDRVQDRDLHVAAGWLRVDAARVSNLRRGQLDRFSLQALVRMLARLGDDVRVDVTSYRALHQRELRQIRADHEARIADWRSRLPFAAPRAAATTAAPAAAQPVESITPRRPAGASPP